MRITIMPLRRAFANSERETMGALVNNLSVYSVQILSNSGPGFSTRALANLTKLRNEHEELLRCLDELARTQNEESPLRLIEDLPKLPSDIAEALTIVRRCLSASAFIGHLIAHPMHTEAAAEAIGEKRLH